MTGDHRSDNTNITNAYNIEIDPTKIVVRRTCLNNLPK